MAITRAESMTVMVDTRADSMTDWVQGQMKREMCDFFNGCYKGREYD